MPVGPLHVCVLLLVGTCFCLAACTALAEATYAERLGWPAGSRVVILHVDDVGMCHGANVGAIEAIEKGVATSMSIMFPCPWVPEIARYLRGHPEVDAGVHLTLNSEWLEYRWGPVAGKQAVPGLVDKEGCLHRGIAQVMFGATPDEVETEMRAQIDRCLSLGIKPTHLDSHMGTVFATIPFCERYLKIGAELGIPVMLPGGHGRHISKQAPIMPSVAKEMGRRAWQSGLPVIDDLYITSAPPEGKTAELIDFLRTLEPGITQYIVHSTRPTATYKHISSTGPARLGELEVMLDPQVGSVIEEEGIIRTTWRELKQRRDQLGR